MSINTAASKSNTKWSPVAPAQSLRISIIGAGPQGQALATQLVRVGHNVSISNSRGPETLEITHQTGASAMDLADAIREADVVIVAIPLGAIHTLKPIVDKNMRPDTIVVDSGNYYPLRDGPIEGLATTTPIVPDSVWLSTLLDRPVVKAFNNIISPNIVTDARTPGAKDRCALPVAGDNKSTFSTIMRLINEIGFDAWHAGPLKESWRFQPGQPSYCSQPSLAELPQLIDAAISGRALEKARDEGYKLAHRLPSDFPPATLRQAARFMAGLDRWKPKSWLALLRIGCSLVWSMTTGAASV